MSNYLGVISDSKPISPIIQNLSFADLDNLAELLMADTNALEEDFQRQSEAILQQEMRLHANVEQILALEHEIKILRAGDNILDRDLCIVFNDIENLDKEISKMSSSSNYICKCAPKSSKSYLKSLLKASEIMGNLRNSVETASSEATFLNQHYSVFVSFLKLNVYFKLNVLF